MGTEGHNVRTDKEVVHTNPLLEELEESLSIEMRKGLEGQGYFGMDSEKRLAHLRGLIEKGMAKRLGAVSMGTHEEIQSTLAPTETKKS